MRPLPTGKQEHGFAVPAREKQRTQPRKMGVIVHNTSKFWGLGRCMQSYQMVAAI
uniref:Uncharacterized protein n=1 Tax=Rhizophora mucronata TaxID=61149 RepID=A0A2P2IJU1_RHIMU